MGLRMYLQGISDERIAEVLASPQLILQVLGADERQFIEKKKPGGFFARLLGRRDPDPLAELDKAWHALHYLLTQTAWEGISPLNFLLCGGAEIGEEQIEELAEHPVRIITSSDVRRVDEALRSIDEEFLRSRFNPAEMMRLEIYPGMWDRDQVKNDDFGYCMFHFRVLKKFVAQTARDNQGMIIQVV